MQGHQIGLSSWSRAIVVATERERISTMRMLRGVAREWSGREASKAVLRLLPQVVVTMPEDDQVGPLVGREVEYAIDNIESVLVQIAVRLGSRQLPSVVSINGEATVRSVVERSTS